MTVLTSTNIAGPYSGDGSNTAFDFSFKVFSSADLQVVVTDEDDVETTLTLNTHYSVSIAADNLSGTITYPLSGSPLPATSTLSIIRVVDYTQGAAFQNQGGFYPKTHENAYDKSTMQIQQLKEQLDRAPKFTRASALTDVSLTPENGKYLSWSGGTLTNSAGTGADAGLRTDLAASTGSTLIGYLASGVGTIVTTLKSFLDKLKRPVTKYGAVGDGVTDDYAAIRASLDDRGYAYLTSLQDGTTTYVCNTSIELGNRERLILDHDVILQQNSGDGAPLVWLKGDRAALIGKHFATSRIRKLVQPTVAAVVIGAKDYTVQTNSSDRCYIGNMRISGAAGQGDVTDNPYAALAVWNPQLSGYTSYFHCVENVMLENANYGLHLRGNANAGMYNNIHLFETGANNVQDFKDAIDTHVQGAGIYIQRADENQITNVFHHESDDSVTVLFHDTPKFNSICNVVSEQGGTAPMGVATLDDTGTSNYIQLHDNVLGGNDLGTNFRKLNTIVLSERTYVPEIWAEDSDLNLVEVTTIERKTVRNSGTVMVRELHTDHVGASGLTENTAYKLLDLVLGNNGYGYLVEIRHCCRISGFNSMGAGVETLSITRNNSGTVAATSVQSDKSSGLTISTNVSSTTCSIRFTTPNNGGATTGHHAYFHIRILGLASTYTYTLYDEPTPV